MAITEDSSTPAVVTGTSGRDIVTAAFSPPANTLLLAIVGVGWTNSGTNGCSMSDTGSHTWTSGVAATGTRAGYGGLAQIFYTYLTSAASGITVKAATTAGGISGGGLLLALRVLNGAAANQGAAASGTAIVTTATTAADVSVTTTVPGSLVYGLSDDAGTNAVWSANGSTTVVNNYNDSTDGITLAAWVASAATTTPGATTLGGSWGTTDVSNTCGFEVLPLILPPRRPLIQRQIIQRVAVR